MPTYEYRCEACGYEFEKFQSITAAPIRKCPECKKLKVRRLIGAGAGLIFKGSGFYETDYRSESYKKAAESDGAASKKEGNSSKGDQGTAKGDGAKPDASAKSAGKSGGDSASSGSGQTKGTKPDKGSSGKS